MLPWSHLELTHGYSYIVVEFIYNYLLAITDKLSNISVNIFDIAS